MPYNVDGGPQQWRQNGGYGPSAGSVGGADPQSRFLGQFFDAYKQGVVGPQLAADNSQIANLMSQLQIGNAQGDVQGQQLQQQYGFDTQNLGLQQQQQQVQQGALDRSNAAIGTQQGFANQQFGLQGQSQALNFADQLQSEKGGAAARGAINTAGHGQALSDINARNSIAGQELGLQQQRSDFGFQQQREGNADTQKNLDILSKQLGISGQEMKSRLDNALQQIGLSNQLSTDQVVGEIGKIRNGEYSVLSNIMPQLAQIAGLQIFAGGQ